MHIKFIILLFIAGSIHTRSFAVESGQQEKGIEQCAYDTACNQATFTFQVDNSEMPPFFVHFTNHYLPLSQLNIHTHNLIKAANTVVIEARPIEEEPLDQLDRAQEVFKDYCLDAEFHSEFRKYMEPTYTYYNDFKERFNVAKDKYNQISNEKKCPLAKMLFDANFEELSPSFISYLKDIINLERKKENGMDYEIDDYALEHQKTRAGLDSVLKKFIWRTPKHLPLLKNISPEERESINVQLCSWLNCLNCPQKADEVKENAGNSDEDMYEATYKSGKFFQNILHHDQNYNQKEDPDCVHERNLSWIPGIEEIIAIPDLYPPPVLICVGSGHHDILRLLEEKGNLLKILNQNGEWHPFSYTRLYRRFQEENLYKLTPDALKLLCPRDETASH